MRSQLVANQFTAMPIKRPPGLIHGCFPGEYCCSLHILKKVDDAGAGFRSLTDAIDTTTAAGRMMMQMLGAVAGFERAMLRERTKLGLARAGTAGRKGGARLKLSLAGQQDAISQINAGKTQTEVAEFFNVHRSTISRLVSERRVLERKA